MARPKSLAVLTTLRRLKKPSGGRQMLWYKRSISIGPTPVFPLLKGHGSSHMGGTRSRSNYHQTSPVRFVELI
jgi:hypothetical protein